MEDKTLTERLLETTYSIKFVSYKEGTILELDSGKDLQMKNSNIGKTKL